MSTDSLKLFIFLIALSVGALVTPSTTAAVEVIIGFLVSKLG